MTLAAARPSIFCSVSSLLARKNGKLSAIFLVLGLVIPTASVAEPGEGTRVLLINPAEACSTLDMEELRDTVTTYLAGRPVHITIDERPLEDGGQAGAVAAQAEANIVFWCVGSSDRYSVNVLDLRGDTPELRTQDVNPEPATTVHRTVAAVVWTVVDSGFFDLPAPPEPEPSPLEVRYAACHPPAEFLPPWTELPEPPRRWSVAAAGRYTLRMPQSPGPLHHALGLHLLVSWDRRVLGVMGGRFSLAAPIDKAHGGTARHAGTRIGLGYGIPIGLFRLGALAGADLEWLWGEAATGQGTSRRFSVFAPGVSAELFARVDLPFGLVVLLAGGLSIRPKRTTFLMHGTAVSSTGLVEGEVSLSIGWRIL